MEDKAGDGAAPALAFVVDPFIFIVLSFFSFMYVLPDGRMYRVIPMRPAAGQLSGGRRRRIGAAGTCREEIGGKSRRKKEKDGSQST